MPLPHPFVVLQTNVSGEIRRGLGHSDGAVRPAGATWSGRSGTPLARLRRLDRKVALMRDIMEARQPTFCRRAAGVLGSSRGITWRWRMTIIGVLTPQP